MRHDRPNTIAKGAGWLTTGAVLMLSWQLAGCGGQPGEPTAVPASEQDNQRSPETVGGHGADAGDAVSSSEEEQSMPMGDANEHGMSPPGAPENPRSETGEPDPIGGDASEAAPGDGPTGGAPGVSLPNATVSPSPLALEAIALARSADAADHERLVSLLLDTAWLDRLDSPELALVARPESLQLGLVLDEAAARATLVLDRLIASPLYARPGHRQIALINASAGASEPGEPLVKFWRSQLDPDADELESTVSALVRNQSPEAMGVLEEAITADVFDDGLVFWWFRGPMLERRQDAPILSMADRLLKSDRLSGRRRAALVESLFDYRPRDWYAATEQPPRPPAREKLDDRTRGLLRSIADSAVGLGVIDASRRARIESELAPAAP